MTIETNDAIQDEDVSVAAESQGAETAAAAPDAADKANTPRLTPHASALEAIAAKLYGEDESSDKTSDIPSPSPSSQTIYPQDQLVKVKIDGEEKELPLSEVVKGYQKDQTASRRLEEAAEERRRIEEERARLQAEIEALKNPKPATQTAETQQTAESSAPSKEDVRRLYERLMLGDEEQGMEALAELLTKGRGETQQPTIPVEQVASEAAEIAQRQIDYNLALRNFEQKFQDLAKDPDLKRMTVNLVYQTAQTSSTYDEAFEKAANVTRDWVRKKVESLGLSVQAPANERLERKQQIDNLPTASVRQPAKPAPKEESPSEIIANMRKARGLPV